MTAARRRELASAGGRAAQKKGAHKFTSEEAREAGKKGGKTTSKDRKHMAKIGKKGGSRVSSNKKHMAEIGKKGGAASATKKVEDEQLGTWEEQLP